MVGSAILRWRSGPPRCFGFWPAPATPRPIAMKAANGAVQLARPPTMTTYSDDFQLHASSATEQILEGLQLYGYHPTRDEPDPRSPPEDTAVAGAVVDIFDALVSTLSDTSLEPDLGELLWSTVNIFHRAVERLDRQLDDNEQAQRTSQRAQDGSEVRSVELERLIAEGAGVIDRRNTIELFRDQAIDRFELHTGSAWRQRAGSLVSRRTLTASMIDSRDFLAAKQRAERQTLLPAGPKVVVSGGLDFNDYQLIWDRLDKARAKHPDMVLLHGGSPKGAELIASKWAGARNVPQIAFKPDWTKHGKAAPFRRNDAMLAELPIGVLCFPGSGIQANLADKARQAGVPVWRGPA
jgi:hypothetical protein